MSWQSRTEGKPKIVALNDKRTNWGGEKGILEKWLFRKTREKNFRFLCRSTPARYAASPYQDQGHPNGQNRLKKLILLLNFKILHNYRTIIWIRIEYEPLTIVLKHSGTYSMQNT